MLIHPAAPGGLEEIHEAEAALADGGVDSVAVDNGDEQENVVEVLGIVLIRELHGDMNGMSR